VRVGDRGQHDDRSVAQAGVAAVYGGDFCTFDESDRFFSHRREAPCGRMATLIWRVA